MSSRVVSSWLVAAALVTTGAAAYALHCFSTTARKARASTTPVARLDHRFHTAYDALRSADAKATPVLIVLGESLVLLRGSRTTARALTRSAVSALKAIAHLPIGIFVSLQTAREGDALLDAATRRTLNRFRGSLANVTLADLDPARADDADAIVRGSRLFLDRILAGDRMSAADLAAFAREMGPVLLRVTAYATELQLEALHASVEALLEDVPADERERLEVVVAGAHQARVRSLGLQYFQKRFREAPGEERRVVYAEAVTTAEEARALVGTRALDRTIARAFFGDAKRLQRDVLGDAAATLLTTRTLPTLSRAPS